MQQWTIYSGVMKNGHISNEMEKKWPYDTKIELTNTCILKTYITYSFVCSFYCFNACKLWTIILWNLNDDLLR